MIRWKPLIAAAFIVLSGVMVFFAVQKHPLIADERAHFWQTVRFLHGDLALDPHLTTVPGYHVLLSGALKLTHLSGLASARLLNWFLSLACILIFYLTARRLNPEDSVTRTLQFYLLPIFFPYFFLVYTDVLSNFLVLTALFLILKRRYWWAGAVSILNLLVRQTSVVWSLLLSLLIYTEGYGTRLDRKMFPVFLKKISVFLLGFAIFAAFVAANHGVSIGDRLLHPSGRFWMGNVYFALFVFFFLFLPLNLANLGKIAALFKDTRNCLSLLSPYFLVLTAVTLIRWFPFEAQHPYNQVLFPFWLRVRLIDHITSHPAEQVLFYAAVIYSLLSLRVTSLKRQMAPLLYCVSFAYLSNIWLIEHRYYLTSFTIFLLFREKTAKWAEYASVLFYAGLTGYFFWGIAQGRFFL